MKVKPAKHLLPGKSLPGITLFIPFTGRHPTMIAIGISLLAVVSGLLYVLSMKSGAGAFGFPLDDSWIPLTFARNLREFGVYSYFGKDVITSGSTSPLYVFLLAALGFIYSNEFVLTFGVGIAAFAVSAYFIHGVGRRVFTDEPWLAIVAALSFVVYPLTQSAALSGMSTMLFTALLTGSIHFYFQRKSILFFVFAGLALWVRPDALIFILAATLHLVSHHVVLKADASTTNASSEKRVSKQAIFIGIGLFFLLVLGYGGLNLWLGGAVFPNSIQAKLAYYSKISGEPYLSSLQAFYTLSLGAVYLVFVVTGLIFLLIDILKRRNAPLLMAAAYLLGSIAAYGIFFPFLFEGGRYLVPTIPFFVLVGVWGVRRISIKLYEMFPFAGIRTVANGFALTVYLIAVIVGIAGWSSQRKEHYSAIAYVQNRQVAAAEWINTYTKPSAIVATHQIGAIGYYGKRKLLDMTGVVTPRIIPSIGNLHDLETFIRGSHVDYIATLREQIEVVNEEPLFLSDPRIPEIIEVFKYVPFVTHIMPQQASVLNIQAARLMQQQLNAQAMNLLEQSYKLDQNSVRTSTLLGLCFLNLADTTNALTFLEQALAIQIDYTPAMVPLGEIYLSQKKYTQSYTILENALRIKPDLPSAKRSYEKLLQRHASDSLIDLGNQTRRIAQ